MNRRLIIAGAASRLVNVTPYPDAKHYPLPRPGGDILFLVDDKAQPIVTDKLVAPLPLRFFPLSDEDGLVAYVKQLNDDEQEKCRRISVRARPGKRAQFDHACRMTAAIRAVRASKSRPSGECPNGPNQKRLPAKRKNSLPVR